MFFKFVVPVPPSEGKITFKKRKDAVYVNYEYARIYLPDRQYTNAKRTTIGKLVKQKDRTKMYPNPNFYKYFPDQEFPDLETDKRSSCIRMGAWALIEKVMKDYELSGMISKHIGEQYGLFIDLMAYSLICENNAGQYFPDYADNHPLFTPDMHIYSDSMVSEFLNSIRIDQSIDFLNEWNESRDHRERIYISYDSTNKICQAGDIELAEFGHSKTGIDKPVINYSIAYDSENNEPLFYEDYCGSIVDVSQLQYMLERAKGYGYKKIGFILDRGYFSEGNIHYMDNNGYDFIIMMKGMKSLASETVLSIAGTFEKDRKNRIDEFHVSGITIKKRLFQSDKEERYFHIYYSDHKAASERDELEKNINKQAKYLKKMEGSKVPVAESFKRYFDLVYWHEGEADQTFTLAVERTDVTSRETALCGYFIIITSKKMTAKEALLLYKSRDASEKLFRGDKSYLGNKALRVYSEESSEAKIFIEFVALIIRNRIYRKMKEYMLENDVKRNYLDVPAAIRELEKIEMIRYSDRVYRLSHAVTATQKTILKAFGLDEKYIRTRARELSIQLESVEKRDGKKDNYD
jgi:transposase